ncbi:class I SAM-dependent methyltransferase [Prosthecobacter sp.]|uniref:class I SAM-dependent methyltransferase n=1 Tax=Prosthecobacter sp. TaxID=1965333 RepID=UPI002AB9319B|nr:class I SAM-dependent methyltransferase [Prosthecobacter sp.]MDZ4402109.1 class I SAM-dependent methyltransferase [Prosthecobacter sp.]
MNFDPLAQHYRWMEALFAGERLQRCRTAFLEAIPAPTNVLVYGEGNGRFLVELCRRFPTAGVTVVDASPVMIKLARERLRREGLKNVPVEFIHADALTWEPPVSSFDLIVTCFFLDCFREDQLQQLMPTIARAATPKARWLIADFKLAESGLRRLRSRLIVALLYAFFRCVTRLPASSLIAPEPWLMASGFTLMRHEEHDHGMLYSDWWER